MPEHSLPTVALLAGGLARRMQPATLGRAKSMLLVAGEPFLAHQLRLLTGQGVRHIVICCGHLEEQLRAFAGDGSRWGCTVEYSADGDRPLGTGGAIRMAIPLLGPAFMVIYGDSYLTTPLQPVWDAFCHVAADRENGARKDGLMTVHANAGRWDRSNVEFADGSIRVYDKERRTAAMEHIDYGLNCFRPEAFAGWQPGDVFDLARVSQLLLARGALAGFEVSERFYEIGSMTGLAETDALLGAGQPALRARDGEHA